MREYFSKLTVNPFLVSGQHGTLKSATPVHQVPLLVFQLLSPKNQGCWMGRNHFMWHPGPICGCNISILNKELFMQSKMGIFLSFDWYRPKICWVEHTLQDFHIDQQTLLNLLTLSVSLLTGPPHLSVMACQGRLSCPPRTSVDRIRNRIFYSVRSECNYHILSY